MPLKLLLFFLSLQLKEIEDTKEEITNLNFLSEQKKSHIESQTKDLQQLKEKIDADTSDFENRALEYKEREIQLRK